MDLIRMVDTEMVKNGEYFFLIANQNMLSKDVGKILEEGKTWPEIRLTMQSVKAPELTTFFETHVFISKSGKFLTFVKLEDYRN